MLNMKQSKASEEPMPVVQYTPGSPEEKALLRKIDRRLIPAIWLMYVMSYIDRANIGNAKTGGMQADLHLTSTEYSIALLVFFVGYVIGEVPSNMVLTRVSPKIYLPSLMSVWGCVSLALAGCKSYKTLSVVRFFLGLVEAGFAPGIIFYLSSWYKRHEMGKRFAIYYTASAISGAVGGLLAGAITGHLDGASGLQGWQWLFIIEGLATIAASCIAFFMLPAYPQTTSWLSPEEKALCSARLVYDGIGSADGPGAGHGHMHSLKAAVSDWRTWIFTFCFMMITGSQTITYFIPTLMGLLGHKGTNAQYWTIPVYIVAAVMILIFAYSSDRLQERANHLSIATAVAAAGFLICMVVPNNHKVQYAFLCIGVGGIYACVPICLTWVSNVISWPAEKRAVVQALVNALGNSASIYGSFLWPATDSPRYFKGFGTTLAMLTACSVVSQVMKVLFRKFPYEIMDEAEPNTYPQLQVHTGTETPEDVEKGDVVHSA